MNYEIVFLKKGINGCTHYRVDIPAKHLRNQGFNVTILESVDDIDLSQVNHKLFIFGRACFLKELKIFREIKNRGGKVFYEIDDDLLDLAYWNPSSKFYFKLQVYIRDFLREADGVVVTTEDLRNSFLKYNSHIYVVDNYIDFDYQDIEVSPAIFDKSFKTISLDVLKNRFVVLWGGSTTHREDLRVLTRSLIVFLKRNPEAVFLAIHTVNQEILNNVKSDQIFLVNAVFPRDYLGLLKELNAKVGLAPLAKHSFNLCKSRLKIIEYMTLGFIPLSSNYGPYNLALKDTPFKEMLCNSDQWLEKLEWSLKLNYPQIQEDVFSFARSHFDIKQSNWVSVLDSLMK